MFLINSYIFGVISAAVNPVIRAASYTDQSGGNPDLVSPEVEYTDLGGADSLTVYGCTGTNPITVSKAQLKAGSGGTNTLEFFSYAYNAGTDSDVITGLTATSNAANRIAFYVEEDNNGGTSDIETVTVSGLDFTAPAAPTAATNTAGNAITLPFAEAVYGTQDTADWVVSGAGTTTVSAVTGFGTSSLVLTLAGDLVARGDTVTLAYTETDSEIRDANGNALANFSGLAVTNNVAGAFSPIDLFGGTYTEGYWPTNGDTNMWQDAGKSVAASSASDLVRVIESAGSGPDMTTTSDANRLTRGADGLLTTTSDTQYMGTALASRGADMLFMAVVNTTDTNFYLALTNATANIYFGRVADGDSSTTVNATAGTPTYYVNGTQITSPTRDSLHTAIATGSDVVVEVVGVDSTANAFWSNPTFLGRSLAAERITGPQGDYIWMENPGDAGRAQLRQFLADRHGITVSGGVSGGFDGVTPSATGIYADSNTPGTSYTQSFAVENAPGVTALIAVHTRTNRNGVALAETSLGSATLVGSAIASASSVYLYKLDCPGVDSIELTVSTTSNKLDDFGVSVYHARDITVGTPQTSTTAAGTQTVSITATAGNSVVAFGTANNPNGGTTAVGVTEDYDDTTWGGGDYMVGGHVDGVFAGAASYGFTWNATPGNSAVIAVEIQAA